MRLEKTFTSDSRQLMGMGFSCPSNSDASLVDTNSPSYNFPEPLPGTETPAQAQITKSEAQERLDTAIGLFRMAVSAEGKLINSYQVDPDDPKAEAIATDYCGNLDLLMETSRNLGEIGHHKNAAFLSDPDLSDRVKQLMRLEKTFVSDSRQLTGMGFFCPSNSDLDPS